MRVMLWPAVFWPHIGGVQTMAAGLMTAMQERGHEFIVVTERGSQGLPSEDEYEGIAVFRFPFASVLRDADQLMEVRREVIRLKREFAADLLHTAAVSASDFFNLTTKAAHPAPWLVSLLGAWPNGFRSLVRYTLTSADWVVGCSHAILQRGLELVPQISSCSSVIYNAQKPCATRPRPLKLDPPVLLYLGRLSREKGVDRAIAAFAALVKRFPRIRLVIAGDGPERDALEQRTVGLGLEEAVQFLGWVSPEEVPGLICEASVVILPSREDAFPLVGLEAALMERPVVATKCGGIPEMIVDRETGLLIEKASDRDLAEAVRSLIERPDDARRMGRAARRRALRLFGFEKHVEAYDELYKALVSSGRMRDGCRRAP